MEDDRDRLIVIVAGYKREMDNLISSNPGIKSRFTQYFEFEDYEPRFLLRMLMGLAKEHDLRVSPALGLKAARYFKEAYSSRDETFGNGRLVRNVFENILQQQANRVISAGVVEATIINSLDECDFMLPAIN